jgi:hypothetical protein
MPQIGLREVDLSSSLAEGDGAELLVRRLIEHVVEEGVDGMVLGELLLEDEHVVYVAEDSVEVG